MLIGGLNDEVYKRGYGKDEMGINSMDKSIYSWMDDGT